MSSMHHALTARGRDGLLVLFDGVEHLSKGAETELCQLGIRKKREPVGCLAFRLGAPSTNGKSQLGNQPDSTSNLTRLAYEYLRLTGQDERSVRCNFGVNAMIGVGPLSGLGHRAGGYL